MGGGPGDQATGRRRPGGPGGGPGGRQPAVQGQARRRRAGRFRPCDGPGGGPREGDLEHQQVAQWWS